jgi:hypothetical protein
MGSEAFIFPLTLLGILALVSALVCAVITKLALVRWLLLVLLLGVVAVSFLQYSSDLTLAQNTWLILMALGFFAFAGFFVIGLLSLILLPFKPVLLRVLAKLGVASKKQP